MKEEKRYNAAKGKRRAGKGRERTEECVLWSVGRGFQHVQRPWGRPCWRNIEEACVSEAEWGGEVKEGRRDQGGDGQVVQGLVGLGSPWPGGRRPPALALSDTLGGWLCCSWSGWWPSGLYDWTPR